MNNRQSIFTGEFEKLRNSKSMNIHFCIATIQRVSYQDFEVSLVSMTATLIWF